jgi:UbiD family decarboxylase
MKGKSTLLVVYTIVFALSLSSFCFSEEELKTTGPYDTLRDYIAALDARGKLMRIKEMDQDEYEVSALFYRMKDKLGRGEAPAVWIDRVKINGAWVEGPLVANLYCGWDTAAMVFGAEKITDNQREMYGAAVGKIKTFVDEEGRWKKIEPVTMDKSKAPCKEVIALGDDVNILKFPWLKNNPGDGGRYINSGSVIMEDPELGRNVGTYRCQVKGKKKIGINTETGQHGWHFMMRARERGEPMVQAAVAIGVDPITFSMSSTRLADLGEDELAYAGGFRGKPVELVKCETSGILVPAQAEMIIEGEIPTMEIEEEGPYGEMFGFMGLKHRNFYRNVKAITHRRKPVFTNSGGAGTTHMIPWMVANSMKLKKGLPNLVKLAQPAFGMRVVSINKRLPGEGLEAGQFFKDAKVVIVVDKDVDPANPSQVLNALATRWQPHPASIFVPQTRSTLPDPSQPKRGLTSRIIIDATKQFPEEGGPETWPPENRALLEKNAPRSFDLVDKRWPEYLEGWGK